MFGKKNDPDGENKAGENTAQRDQGRPYREVKGGRQGNGPLIGDVSRRLDVGGAAPGRRPDNRGVADLRGAELRPVDARPEQPRTPEAAPRPEPRPSLSPEPRAAEPRQESGEMRKLIVGRDIVLQGEIRACQKLVVEGRVEAALNDCRSVEITGSGFFKGSARIETADISGTFEGDIIVTKLLTVRSTGRILGTVQYHVLEIERGGVISGQVEVLGGDHAVSSNGWAGHSDAEVSEGALA